MDIFQIIYLIGLVVGIAVYFLLSKFIKVSDEKIKQDDFKKYIFLRTVSMFWIGFGIIAVSTLFGFTGMAIAVGGLGVITVGFVTLFVEIFIDKKRQKKIELNSKPVPFFADKENSSA